MRATYFMILATWVLSVHRTPIQIGKHRERRMDTGPSGLRDGQQILSPCPDLIDPTTKTTALYFYRGNTQEQRRSTQFINDNWGLSGCCNSQVPDACPPPPDPQPAFSPCPGLKNGSGKTLFFFYNNPYTTDQVATDLFIIYAKKSHNCSPSNEHDGGSVSSSPGTNVDLQAGDVQPPNILPPSNLSPPLSNKPAPGNLALGANIDTSGADNHDGYSEFGLNT